MSSKSAVLEVEEPMATQTTFGSVEPSKVAKQTASSNVAKSSTRAQQVFARKEKKYLLSSSQWYSLVARLGASLQADKNAAAHISSLYLDTADDRLIRASIEKPQYKEKLRVRAYGKVLSDKHTVFMEIKKKFDGIVYKRRVEMTLQEAQHFIELGIMPSSPYKVAGDKRLRNVQILKEMQWSLEHYSWPKPKALIAYDREAFIYSEGGASARITKDRNVTHCAGSWAAFCPAYVGRRPQDQGTHNLIAAAECLMELKCEGSMPVQLAQVLAELGIYTQSFSKVGRAYGSMLAECKQQRQVADWSTEVAAAGKKSDRQSQSEQSRRALTGLQAERMFQLCQMQSL